MPPLMRRKAMAYRRWEDAYAYVLGRQLLAYDLKTTNSNYCLADITYPMYGRPTIAGYHDFNISHSGNLVVCAVSANGSVGIDVEKRQPLDVADFKNQFSSGEWNKMHQSPSPLHTFYDYWTKKEAILKADGRGLIDNLAALDVSDSDPVRLDNNNWYVKQLDAFEHYTCPYCGQRTPHQLYAEGSDQLDLLLTQPLNVLRETAGEYPAARCQHEQGFSVYCLPLLLHTTVR
jgi:4'-phosphopantetheinyl transferase